MFLFAHLGITLGSAVIAAGINDTAHEDGSRDDNRAAGTNGSTIRYRIKSLAETVGSWFKAFSRKIDARAILIGAALPDIIDKTIGHLILAGVLDNGRIFAHSLLFLLLVTVTGVIVNRYSRNKFMLFMAYGVLVHLVLDAMWLNPHTLFWPLLGVAFEPGEPGNYLLYLLNSLGNTAVLIPEIIGFAIMAGYGIWLIGKKRVLSLIKYGRFEA